MAQKKKQAGKKGVQKRAEQEAAQLRLKQKHTEKVQEKYAVFVIAGMILIGAAFAGFFYIYSHAADFNYHGMKFSRVNSNGLNLYQTTLQVTRSEGNFNLPVYLRNDPRSLDSIPTNISLVLRVGTFIAIDPLLSGCYGSNLGPYEVSTVLSAFGVRPRGATTDEATALTNNVPLMNCSSAVNRTVILMQQSSHDSISQDGECYVLNISNCRTTEVSERFILETISQFLNTSAAKK